MDSIDFNSYLAKETEDLKKTDRYRNYEALLHDAQSVLIEIIDKSRNNKIINNLYKAKLDRVNSRELTRSDEKKALTESRSRLISALALIKPKDFEDPVGNNFYEKNHWAKVLLYNELSICYSGLTETSISLGYAIKAISLLEALNCIDYETDDEKSKNLLFLYTFALYNKGEAERLLHSYEESLKTFLKIVEIYEKQVHYPKSELSDYFSALHKIALMLIDIGRGEEALSYLKNVTLMDEKDYRKQEYMMEEARARIDMKQYEPAFEILNRYQNPDWAYTFTYRKAKVNVLRLLLEYRKNRAKDFFNGKIDEFESSEFAFLEKVRREFQRFEDVALNLMIESSERKDGDIFRETCLNYAIFCREEKASKKAISCYHLYLMEKELSNICTPEEIKSVIEKWLARQDFELDTEIIKSLCKTIEEVGSVDFLKGFFDTYISYYLTESKEKPSQKNDIIIQKLKNCLTKLYEDNNNFIRIEKVKESYSLFSTKLAQEDKVPKQKSAEIFVNKSFFEGKLLSNKGERTSLNADSIENLMRQNTLDFANRVVGKTQRFHLDDSNFIGRLLVLRRWNSFTPALASTVNPSKGGGYFLYFSNEQKSLGIAVDPGYNFLENLFASGFHISDINCVIVSHDHPDHAEDLPRMLSLFHEANDRLGAYYHQKVLGQKHFNKHQLKLILSQGVYDQYSSFIKLSEDCLEDIIIAKSDSPIIINLKDKANHSFEIQPIGTGHKDLSDSESLGFVFKVKKNGLLLKEIGYTSDARWSASLFEKFKNCNIICIHLGSIVDILHDRGFCSICEKNNSNEKLSSDCEECKRSRYQIGTTNTEMLFQQTRQQNHLYLSGLALFFDNILPSSTSKNAFELAIISEFGEELKGGIRIDLYKKFDAWFQSRTFCRSRCLPGDIGLEIDLVNTNVICSCCQKMKPRGEIVPITFGKEEAICFICNECKEVLSVFQIGERLKDYCENGKKMDL